MIDRLVKNKLLDIFKNENISFVAKNLSQMYEIHISGCDHPTIQRCDSMRTERNCKIGLSKAIVKKRRTTLLMYNKCKIINK